MKSSIMRQYQQLEMVARQQLTPRNVAIAIAAFILWSIAAGWTLVAVYSITMVGEPLHIIPTIQLPPNMTFWRGAWAWWQQVFTPSTEHMRHLEVFAALAPLALIGYALTQMVIRRRRRLLYGDAKCNDYTRRRQQSYHRF